MNWYIFKTRYSKEVEVRAQNRQKAEKIMDNILIRSANKKWEYIGFKTESEMPMFSLPKQDRNYEVYRLRNKKNYHLKKTQDES